MPRRIIWTERGRSELRSLHPATKQAIRRSLREIDSLWAQDVKPLRGHGERYTLRVGGYRVILLQVDGADDFVIERVASRDIVYDDYPLPDESG